MNILSLSGGGAQGLFTALVLKRLEANYGKLSSRVDFLAGTSIGSALASGIAWGIPAADISDLFEENVHTIFPSLKIEHPDVSRLFRASQGVVSARYRVEPWRRLLEQMFGDAKFGDSPFPLVVPAIDLETCCLKKFRSWDVEDGEHLVVDVILASSAAPTFFPIHKMPGGTLYVDGGMSSNAPDMIAITEAVRGLGTSLDVVSLLSIGTALSSPHMKISGDDLDWGLKHWGSKERLSNLSMAITQNTPVCMAKDWLGDNFARIDASPTVEECRHLGLDGVSVKAIGSLKRLSESVDIQALPKSFF